MRILPYSLILISIILTLKVNGQCTANAGVDQVVCVGFFSMDTITIGGNPIVSGGVPPYTYKWETMEMIGSFTLTASVFLNDTTLANPTIINSELVSSLTFKLTVMDSLGNSCSDSTLVRFSRFGHTLEDKGETIVQGDTVQIYPGVGGAIPPLTYQWTPMDGLSDANIGTPFASPDTTTYYLVTVTDSAGCQVTDQDAFEVNVTPVGIGEHEKRTIKTSVFPNPLTQRSILKIIDSEEKTFNIQFFNASGLKVKELTTSKTEIKLNRGSFNVGIYFYQILSNNKVLGMNKFIVK